MDSGELCVMTHLGALLPTLYADNWDTLELQHLVWTRASEYGFVTPMYIIIIQCVYPMPLYLVEALVVNRFGLMI